MSSSFNIKSPSFWVLLTVAQNGPSVSAHRERYTGGCVLPSLDCTAQHCSHSSVHVLSKTSSPSSSPILALQNHSLVNPSICLLGTWALSKTELQRTYSWASPYISDHEVQGEAQLCSVVLLGAPGVGGGALPSFLRGCLSSSPSSNFSHTSLCHPILPFSWSCYFILYLTMS